MLKMSTTAHLPPFVFDSRLVSASSVALSSGTFITSAFGQNLVSGLEHVPGLLFASVLGSACLGAGVYRKLDSMLTKVRLFAGSVRCESRSWGWPFIIVTGFSPNRQTDQSSH